MYLCSKHSDLRRFGVMLIAPFAVVLFAFTGCGGGGGGGGSKTGPSGNVTVTGLVLVTETGNPPNPAATVSINGYTTTTGTDGTFSLASVAATATTGSVTATGEQPYTLSLILTNNTGTYNLGNIFISSAAYTASASGTVVTPVKGVYQAVSGAEVTISGSTVLAATDGTFTIPNLAVGLGSDPTIQIGTVQATGYVPKPITTQFPLITGANPLGQIVVQSPVGATPGVPYTISGKVVQGTTGLPNIPVTISTTPSTNTVTDANGNYAFWVVAGAYTITGLNVSTNQSATVNVTLTSTAVPVTAPNINL